MKRLIGNEEAVSDFIRRVEHPHMFGKKEVRQRRKKQTEDIHDKTTGVFMKAEETKEGRHIDTLAKQALIYQRLHPKLSSKDYEPATGVQQMQKESAEAEKMADNAQARMIATMQLEGDMAKMWHVTHKALISYVGILEERVATLTKQNEQLTHRSGLEPQPELRNNDAEDTATGTLTR